MTLPKGQSDLVLRQGRQVVPARHGRRARRDAGPRRPTSSGSTSASPTSPPTATGPGTRGKPVERRPPQAQPPAEAAPETGHQGGEEEAEAGRRARKPGSASHENHRISKAIVADGQGHRSRDRRRRPQRHPRTGHRLGAATLGIGSRVGRSDSWYAFLSLQGASWRASPWSRWTRDTPARRVPECGHCEQSNRKSQSEFLCKACGHESHADVNAARNIRALAVL